MSRTVLVTGLGAVGAFGLGADALAGALERGEVPRREVDRSAGYHRAGGARTALLAGDLDLGSLLPAGQARRMSLPARFAVAAARLALADAGRESVAGERTGVVLGTAFGPARVTEQLLAQILQQSPDAASPALFTESVASAAASQIALAFKARGPSLTITQREASGALALAEGARLVASGAADCVLVVEVEEMSPLLHAALDRFRALARPGADGHEVARPLDRRRDGALAAEGACALVLESAASAAGRRARAAVVGSVRAFDPTAKAWDWGEDGGRLAAALERGLARLEAPAATLEVVVAGAAGSRRGDRLEAAVLRRLFPAGAPPLTAPRGTLGAWGGGFLAAAVLIASGAPLPPTAGFTERDPELALRPAPAGGGPAHPRRTLVSSLATGGAACWTVLAPG